MFFLGGRKRVFGWWIVAFGLKGSCSLVGWWYARGVMHWEPKPNWVIFSGCVLSFLSAAVTAGFFIQAGTSVSHLTGDVARVALETAGGSGLSISARYLLVATICFVCGAAVSGYFVHHPTMELTRPYGRSIMLIGICLLVAQFFAERLLVVSVGLGSFSCGLQNALATHYRGMVLRTTHVTGMLTDFGTNLGMRLKGHRIAAWRLTVPVLLTGSFFLGAVCGALLYFQIPEKFLLVWAVFYLSGGLSWSIYKRMVMRKKISPVA